MMKKMAGLFVPVVVLILAACGGQTGYYPEVVENVIMVERVPTPTPLPEPVPRVFETWQDAYATLLI